jgi:hypothetical protein
VTLVIAGVLQIANQVVSAYSTVQVDTGQRMVYNLRYRLFQHLQALARSSRQDEHRRRGTRGRRRLLD